jgi:hypothetical protein
MRMFVCVTGACTIFLGFSYCSWWRMDVGKTDAIVAILHTNRRALFTRACCVGLRFVSLFRQFGRVEMVCR